MGEGGPGGWGSSLPDRCASAWSLLSASQNPANRDRPLKACFRIWMGFPGTVAGSVWAGQMQEGRRFLSPSRAVSLCSPACPWPLKCTIPGTDLRTRTHVHTHTHTHTYTHPYLSGTLEMSEGSKRGDAWHPPPRWPLAPRTPETAGTTPAVVGKYGGQMGQHRDNPYDSFHKYPLTNQKRLQYPERKASGGEEEWGQDNKRGFI